MPADAADQRNAVTILTQLIATQLAPLFMTPDGDIAQATAAARAVIRAYDPQNPAECLNIGQIVGLSLTAVRMVAEVGKREEPAGDRLRVLAQANSLARTAVMAEKSLRRRPAAGSSKSPDNTSPQPPQSPQPANRPDEAEQVLAGFRAAMATPGGRAAIQADTALFAMPLPPGSMKRALLERSALARDTIGRPPARRP